METFSGPDPEISEQSVDTVDDETAVREHARYSGAPPAGAASEREVVRTMAPGRRVREAVYLVLGVVDGLIAIRILLKLFAANPDVPFARGVYGVTDWLMQPFHGLMPDVGNAGGSVLDVSAFVALAVYALFAVLVARIFELALDRSRTYSRSVTRPGRPRLY